VDYSKFKHNTLGLKKEYLDRIGESSINNYNMMHYIAQRGRLEMFVIVAGVLSSAVLILLISLN
jgi:hypothetical protein